VGGTSTSTGGAGQAAGGSHGGVGGGVGGSIGVGGEPDSAGAPSIGGDAAGGSPEAGSGGTGASPDQAAIEAETIARWNAIADQHDGDLYHFHWERDMFPHPTFAAMGNAEGYQEFAFVLDEFLGVNFDFLAERRQFLTPYYYVTASPADTDLEVTWDELATDFSTMSYGDIPHDVQQQLATYAHDMKAFE
jgi:hypothetical protein